MNSLLELYITEIEQFLLIHNKEKSELSMTEWPGHVWLQKKWYEPQTRQPWGVCYRLLCTDMGDRILCILSLNHNIHVEKWRLPAMDKMSFEVEKCVGNAFSRDLEIQMLKVPPSLSIMGVPQEILA